jgi:putative proteasome-type protease
VTYCLAVRVSTGIVFASDSRTNAGVDYVFTYSKMHVFSRPGDRLFVLLTAGNLGTSQAVVNRIQRDFDDPDASAGLNTAQYLFEAAHYVGRISGEVQEEHGEALRKAKVNPEASFIIGGQIKGQPHDIYQIYPQGNYITASPSTPYLQIGESKYGKPILDRIIEPATSLADAARCALVSLDSTMRANISVGPPLELGVYNKDELELARQHTLTLNSPLYRSLQKQWNEGLKRAFKRLPRFDWESPG